MGLVHHEEGAKALFHGYECRQIHYVPVHAVVTLDHDEDTLEASAVAGKKLVEGSQIIVREWVTGGTGESAAFHDAVVDLAIVDNEIPGTEEGGDGRDIGGVPAHKDHAVFRAVDICQGFLQLALYGALASHKSACASGRSVALHGLHGRSVDPWVSVEAQVVVVGIVAVASAVDDGMGAAFSFMNLEEGVADTEECGSRLHELELLVERMFGKIRKPGIGTQGRIRSFFRSGKILRCLREFQEFR